MKVPASAHISTSWRIHELTRDFEIEDVGAADAGRPGRLSPADGADGVERPVAKYLPRRRALWAIRWKIGALLGWDGPNAGLGTRMQSLRDRLPEDLRKTSGPDFDALPFTSLYPLDNEWAAEIANRTMHGVMHIGWSRMGPAVTAARRPFRSGRTGYSGSAT